VLRHTACRIFRVPLGPQLDPIPHWTQDNCSFFIAKSRGVCCLTVVFPTACLSLLCCKCVWTVGSSDHHQRMLRGPIKMCLRKTLSNRKV